MSGGFHLDVMVHFNVGELEQLQSIKHGDGQFLLPQVVRLHSASINISRAVLSYGYYKRKPDGTEHRRQTVGAISLGTGVSAQVWLTRLLPDDTEPRTLTALLTLLPR